MQTSSYEDIAQSFLDAHPVGSVISDSKLQSWIADNANGSAIKDDLDIKEPSKRISALRRHLNDGGRSNSMAEDRRFNIQIEDAKRKTYVVRSHADVAQQEATNALGKSVVGALSPLKRGVKAVAAVKLDELPEIERRALENARENLLAMERAAKPTLAQEVDRIWVAEMVRRGIDADTAHKIREALPMVTRLQKLLKATT